jgi:cell wall-associated NlpC family hydrolase
VVNVTYDEMYTKLTSGAVSSVQDLIKTISTANTLKTMTPKITQPTAPTTPTIADTSKTTFPTVEPHSSYKFEDWVKNKGYTYAYDPVSGQYKINDVAVDSNLFSKMPLGYGTETQYNNILSNFTNTQNQLNEYKGKYDQQLQDLLSQLENFQGYETPEELQQYLMEIIQSANQPFTYDPTTDTALQTAQEAVGKTVRETAGTKGTLYSSGTLAKTATQQGALIPQFEEKAYSRYSDTQNRKIQLATTLMQWDQMQSDRSMDQLDLIKTKYEYIMNLDSQDFEEFKLALEQQNWQKEYQLQQQQLNLEKKMQEIENAYKRVDAIGYVDNTTSVILGLPVGTKAGWAKELEIQQKNELAKLKKEHENNLKLQKEQKKIDKELINYKQKLQDAADKKKMKQQYEYDKDLADYRNSLEMSSVTGTSNVILNAKSYLGTKYVYGGNSKTKGLDCSALTQQVMRDAGVSLPRTAYEQSKVGTKVSWSNLQPGDLIYFDTLANNKNVDHVGIYIGNGQMIHASSGSGKVVQVSVNTAYWKGKFTVARRHTPGSGSAKIGSGSGSSGSGASVGRNATSTSTKQIQTYLKNYGIGIAADGQYGPSTTAAVKQFQKAKGLTPDGVVGPKTLAALKKYTKSTVNKPYYA